jgi:ParB/RepB/Spo0J family partition protein
MTQNVERTYYPISKIIIDEDKSIRFEQDPVKLNALAESIKQVGQLQPIAITKIPNSDLYRVVAGRSRYFAVKDILKHPDIFAVVRNFKDEIDEFTAQFAENEERTNWSDKDYLIAIEQLRKKKEGLTLADIAKVFNKNIDWIKKKSSHLKIASEFMDETSKRNALEIPTSLILELGIIDSFKMRENVLIRIECHYDIECSYPTVKEVKNFVKEVLQTKESAIKHLPKKQKPVTKKESKPKEIENKAIDKIPETLYTDKFLKNGKLTKSEKEKVNHYICDTLLIPLRSKITKLEKYVSELKDLKVLEAKYKREALEVMEERLL